MTEMFRSDGGGLSRPDTGTLVARAADQTDWQVSAPGFLVKPLYEDAGSNQRTWLMKVEPGAYSPPHAHEELEQFLVIEGQFSDGEVTYGPGDFAIRAPGAIHEASSESGALVVLFYSS
ncbi:cupin domain-containing protein [Minwuia sp.]|uniref:cupin domain-containing protein n=1 Tax=Minwuia sp. TaxID=2493630 RepID=UPI003A8D4B79